jgi:UDP-N-acetylmuramyl tripeptide synthase
MVTTWISVTTGKLAAWASKTFSKGAGTSLPGVVALKVFPQVLNALANQVPLTGRIGITGTNGKTTTAGLIAAFLAEKPDTTVVHNQLGANMLSGITSALLLQTSFNAKLHADNLVLEVDEASLVKVTQQAPLHTLAVTNLFRDQLDRYGELDTTAQFITNAFKNVSNTVVLNADEPLVASMGEALPTGLQACYFGIDSLPDGQSDSDHSGMIDGGVPFPQEVCSCPRCGTELTYQHRFYAQVGHYDCSACGYQRPTPTVQATVLEQSPTMARLQITAPTLGITEPFLLTTTLVGTFNLYNLLTAVSVGLLHGVTPPMMQAALNQYEGVFGRAERRIVQGKAVQILLIKNPAGAAEVLKLVAQDPNARVLIAINDDYADGRDVSWLWDAPFERLLALQPTPERPIWVSGRRSGDMAVRLQYAGIAGNAIVEQSNTQACIQQALAETALDETLYVLPTYTVLLALRTLWETL